MTENKKNLLEFISQNEEAMNRFNQFEGLGKEEAIEKCISLAKEYGFEITKEDLAQDADESQQSRKVSDEELEGVVGGGVCVCVMGGGGKSPFPGHKPCVCVVSGLGAGGGVRCVCFFGGGGRANA